MPKRSPQSTFHVLIDTCVWLDAAKDHQQQAIASFSFGVANGPPARAFKFLLTRRYKYIMTCEYKYIMPFGYKYIPLCSRDYSVRDLERTSSSFSQFSALCNHRSNSDFRQPIVCGGMSLGIAKDLQSTSQL